MKPIAIAALLIALLVTPVAGQAPDKKSEQSGTPEQALLKLTQEWIAAEAAKDAAALDRIIADDFLGTGPGGEVVTKKMVIPEKMDRHALAFTGDDLAVQMWGDMGIVTGGGKWKSAAGELRFTVVFVKREKGWQMVSAHISHVT